MNRLTFNGVTVEFPEDMDLAITDNVLTLRHRTTITHVPQLPTMERVVERIPALKREHTKRQASTHKMARERVAAVTRGFPADFERVVTDYIIEHDNAVYSNALGMRISKVIGAKIKYPLNIALRDRLRKMVDDGILIDLKNTAREGGQPLFAVKALVDKVEEDDTHATKRVA